MRAIVRVVALSILVMLPLGAREGLEAAECFTECRPQHNEVLCKEIRITIGDRESVDRWYWSDGAY